MEVAPTTNVSLRQSVDEMRTAFRLFDMSNTSFVTVNELPLLLRAVGVDASLDTVHDALQAVLGERSIDRVPFSDFRRLVEALAFTPDSEEEASYVFNLLLSHGGGSGGGSVGGTGHDATESDGAATSSAVLLQSNIRKLLEVGAPFALSSNNNSNTKPAGSNRTSSSSRFSLDRLFQQMDVDDDGVITRSEWFDFLSSQNGGKS